MILDAIRQLYEADAEDHVGRGNPTGSRFGSCAAQTQMLRFREASKPEAPRPRNRITWEEGDRVEAWWSSVIERAYPNKSGLQQEPFYFAVPIEAADVDGYARRIATHAADSRRPRAERDPLGIWGTVLSGFRPPAIKEEAERIKLRLVRRDPVEPGRPARLGFVLDPDAKILWAPTYVDRILQHPDVRLAVVEKKSMSNATFRRAVLGNLGYGMRCQGAGLVAATGLPIIWLCYRKETGHLLELTYTPQAERVRIEIRLLNGAAEVFHTNPAHGHDDEPDVFYPGAADAADFPGEAQWDEAATWTPYDKDLLEAIRARIRRVLAFTGDLATVYREYGPDFTCETCDGTRMQTRAKSGRKLLKTPKPCEDCEDGRVDRVDLTFPCSYCAVVKTCWKGAGVELTLDNKPHYTVQRARFVASGLTFHPPEGARAALIARAVAADDGTVSVGGLAIATGQPVAAEPPADGTVAGSPERTSSQRTSSLIEGKRQSGGVNDPPPGPRPDITVPGQKPATPQQRYLNW